MLRVLLMAALLVAGVGADDLAGGKIWQSSPAGWVEVTPDLVVNMPHPQPFITEVGPCRTYLSRNELAEHLLALDGLYYGIEHDSAAWRLVATRASPLGHRDGCDLRQLAIAASEASVADVQGLLDAMASPRCAVSAHPPYIHVDCEPF